MVINYEIHLDHILLKYGSTGRSNMTILKDV